MLKLLLALALAPLKMLARIALGFLLFGLLGLGGLAYLHFFVFERGEDGKILPPAGMTGSRAPAGYDHETEMRRIDERVAVQRQMWESHLERMVAKGASEERLAAEREAAERSMAQNEAGWREMEARRARRWGEAAPEQDPGPGPVEELRARIERSRAKRAASWARWLEGFEGDDLAMERAYVERREAEDRAREDQELADLEARLQRRADAAGEGAARD